MQQEATEEAATVHEHDGCYCRYRAAMRMMVDGSFRRTQARIESSPSRGLSTDDPRATPDPFGCDCYYPSAREPRLQQLQ